MSAGVGGATRPYSNSRRRAVAAASGVDASAAAAAAVAAATKPPPLRALPTPFPRYPRGGADDDDGETRAAKTSDAGGASASKGASFRVVSKFSKFSTEKEKPSFSFVCVFFARLL